jgi:protein TonB
VRLHPRVLAAAEPACAEAPALGDREILETAPHKPPPRYPKAAYAANVEGKVLLGIVIAPDGRVSEARVVRATPSGWFEEAAIECVKQWRYRPPGREVHAQLSIDFALAPLGAVETDGE